jgi:hypothetical protein
MVSTARPAPPRRNLRNMPQVLKAGGAFDRSFGLAMLLSWLARHAVRTPRAVTLKERLGMLPRTNLPIERSVVISWNEHQVPFIEAESDADVAVATWPKAVSRS